MPTVTKKLYYYNAPGGRSTSRRTNCRAAGLICSGGLNGLGAASRMRAGPFQDARRRRVGSRPAQLYES